MSITVLDLMAAGFSMKPMDVVRCPDTGEERFYGDAASGQEDELVSLAPRGLSDPLPKWALGSDDLLVTVQQYLTPCLKTASTLLWDGKSELKHGMEFKVYDDVILKYVGLSPNCDGVVVGETADGSKLIRAHLEECQSTATPEVLRKMEAMRLVEEWGFGDVATICKMLEEGYMK